MKQFLNKTLEIVLFSMYGILPFSYGEITVKWLIIFIPLIAVMTYLHISQKRNHFNIHNFGIVNAVLLMMIFGFAEKVNFIQQFNIPVEINERIPFSIILLTIGMVVFMIKTLFEGKLYITEHPFARHLMFACVFLMILMILFYPFLYYHYQMKVDSNIQLIDQILKYLMILLLTTSYASDGKKSKRLNLGFIVSLSVTVMLSLIL